MKLNASRKRSRREGALERLSGQLSIGKKIDRETKETIPLTDKDVKRIEKEIEILKSRI